jgi:hypothetical protein
MIPGSRERRSSLHRAHQTDRFVGVLSGAVAVEEFFPGAGQR